MALDLSHSLAPLPVMIPLFAAAVLIMVSGFAPRWIADTLSVAAAIASAGLSALLFQESGSGRLIYWFSGWMPRQGAAIGVSFVVDRLGAGMATLTAVLIAAALVFSWRYFDSVGTIFHALMLVFLAGMTAFTLTGDLFDMFVFFEVMGVAAYALTGYKIEESGPLQGALNFAVTNSVGAFFMLTGIALLYGRTGALNMAQIGKALAAGPVDGLVIVAFTLVIVGLMVKGSIVPFHWWLADAHAVAPTPVCVLFSGVMVELGIYGVARVYWDVFSPVVAHDGAAIRGILLGIGVVTVLVGGVMCFLQHHIKRLLAFSTISHAGMFLCGVALLTPLGLAGVALYVLAHGLIKGALFINSGILLNRFSTINELDLHGRARDMPVLAGAFVLGGLGLASLPPFGTFLGKGLIEQSATSLGAGWLVVVLVVGSILTGGAVLRVAGHVFFGLGQPAGKRTGASEEREASSEEPEEPAGRATGLMLVPALVLLVVAFVIGLWPQVGHIAELSASAMENAAAYIHSTLSVAVPGIHGAPALEPAGVEPSDIASGLIGTAGAVLLAVLAIYRQRFPAFAREAGRYLDMPLVMLRATQTGLMTDYVTWIVFGTAALAALFTVFLH